MHLDMRICRRDVWFVIYLEGPSRSFGNWHDRGKISRLAAIAWIALSLDTAASPSLLVAPSASISSSEKGLSGRLQVLHML